MADLGQIQNDQSVAQATTPINTLRSTQANFKPPVSIQGIDQQLDGIQSVGTLQYPVDTPKYFMTFGVSDYTRASLTTIGTLTPIATVILPLPEQMTDTNHVDYGEAALGAFGAAVNAIEQNSGPMMKNMISSAQRVVGARDLTDAANQLNQIRQNSNINVGTVTSGIKGAVTNEISRLPGVSELAGVLGFAPNEFFTILLKGPVYKRHHFTWRFSARNPQESKNLRKIIQSFNNWKSPGTAVGGALFTFPKIFQLAFEPNSTYLYKFKPCVLEDFVIDYAGSGVPTFFRRDNEGFNAPEHIAISMQFLELEYWLTGDFQNENADGTADNDPTHIDGQFHNLAPVANPVATANPAPVTPPPTKFNPRGSPTG